MIKTDFITSQNFPLVLEPQNHMSKEDFLEYVSSQKEFFKDKLLKYGGLLFRNFPIENEGDFDKLIKRLGLGDYLNYIGGDSPRKKIIDGIYTSTEAPPSFKIPLHNELSFVKKFPKHIYFYCHIAPEEKGETIIADARNVYKSISEEVREKFIQKKIKYVSHYFFKKSFIHFVNKSHKSWIDVFETENKQEVERKCRENDFSFAWKKNDWLELSQVGPAAIKHPITNDMVWFNQAHLFDFNPKFLGWWRFLGTKILYLQRETLLHEVLFSSDNSSIPRSEIYHILDILDKNTISFPWRKGDVLVLDNVLAMHGRATFTGRRRILTAMTG